MTLDRAILDTSVFVAREQARPLRQELPDEVAISVVSLAELEIGVLVARDQVTRARRLRTLTEVRATAAAIPIDERTASVYAELAALQIVDGRKPRINDTWIAATAVTNDAEVWTQDQGFSDFGAAVNVVQV